MLGRRVLSFVVSAFLLCSSVSAAPSVSDSYSLQSDANLNLLDDMSIQPMAVTLTKSSSVKVDFGVSVLGYYGGNGVLTIPINRQVNNNDIYYTTDDYRINGNFTANGKLIGWSMSGTASVTYYLESPQVVTLSGEPELVLQITLKNDAGEAAYVIRRDNSDDAFNWSISTDSTVEEPIETTDGWNSGVVVDTITVSCDFNIKVTGLNVAIPPTTSTFIEFNGYVGLSGSSMLIGSGGDPNTGILSGIAGAISGLMQILQAIYEAVTGIPDLISSVISAIQALPGLIADAIKNLFVPSEQDIQELKANYETMLEQKLGFVWQVGDWLTSFANTMIFAFTGGSAYVFEFPGISFSMDGATHEIVPAQTVSLENAFMSVMRPVLGTAVSFICIIAFIRLGEHMLTAIVSGASYFEFLKGDGG